MNIIILGPQASGKGTQASLLADRLQMIHMESGKLLRELADFDPKVDEIINIKGELYPDNETMDLIAKAIEEGGGIKKGVIFDGYPRSVKQYEILKKWLETKDLSVDKAILINVSDKVAIKRLASRRICEECGANYNLITNPPKVEDKCDRCGGNLFQRKDDDPETIKKRLEIYKDQTAPLTTLLEKEGILQKVDGERPIRAIFEEIVEKLKIKKPR